VLERVVGWDSRNELDIVVEISSSSLFERGANVIIGDKHWLAHSTTVKQTLEIVSGIVSIVDIDTEDVHELSCRVKVERAVNVVVSNLCLDGGTGFIDVRIEHTNHERKLGE